MVTTFSHARSFTVISRAGSKTVRSMLSDSAARALCASMKDDFPRDLATRLVLSHKQLAWLHVLANEEMERRAVPVHVAPPAPQHVGGLGKVRELLALAATKLKFPKIRLATSAKQGYILYLAGSKSGSHAGDVAIKERDRYTLGWVTAAGVFIAHPQANLARHPDLIPLLKALSASPTDAARIQGQLTGNCCFCGLPLTDPRSTGAGYGPICADNWGLPWGAETIAPDVCPLIEAPDCPVLLPETDDTPVQQAREALQDAPGTPLIDAGNLAWDWLTGTLSGQASALPADYAPHGAIDVKNPKTGGVQRFSWAEDVYDGSLLAGADYTTTVNGKSDSPVTLETISMPLSRLARDKFAYNRAVLAWLRKHAPDHAEELNQRGVARGWWDQVSYHRVMYKTPAEAGRSIHANPLPGV